MAGFDREVHVIGEPNVRVRVHSGRTTIDLVIHADHTELFVREAKAVRKALKKAIKAAEDNGSF